MRKHRIALALAVVGGIALAGIVPVAPAAAETVKIGLNTWPGYGPLFIARDKGYFKKHGVDVELEVTEGTAQRYAALQDGKVQILMGAAGTAVTYLTSVDQMQYIAGTDDSNGGDGIIAKKSIKSVADLKGKKVALDKASISELYLNVLLQQAGLKESDLDIQWMNADAAGKAFINKEVDAAVTWEPWLSKAKATDFGQILVDSSANPGLLSDVMITTKEFATKHPAETKGVVQAWNEAVAFLNDHQEEAIELMAKDMGGWVKDPKVLAEALNTVKIYAAEDQKVLFGTSASPGPLYETVKAAVDVWTGLGKVKVKVTPENLMNYSFVTG